MSLVRPTANDARERRIFVERVEIQGSEHNIGLPRGTTTQREEEPLAKSTCKGRAQKASVHDLPRFVPETLQGPGTKSIAALRWSEDTPTISSERAGVDTQVSPRNSPAVTTGTRNRQKKS